MNHAGKDIEETGEETPKPWGHCVPRMQVSVNMVGMGDTALKAQSMRKLQVEKEQFSSG